MCAPRHKMVGGGMSVCCLLLCCFSRIAHTSSRRGCDNKYPTPCCAAGSHPTLPLLGFRARRPKFPPGHGYPGVFQFRDVAPKNRDAGRRLWASDANEAQCRASALGATTLASRGYNGPMGVTIFQSSIEFVPAGATVSASARAMRRLWASRR